MAGGAGAGAGVGALTTCTELELSLLMNLNQTTQAQPMMSRTQVSTLSNFGGLVLVWIDSYDSEKKRILQHF